MKDLVLILTALITTGCRTTGCADNDANCIAQRETTLGLAVPAATQEAPPAVEPQQVPQAPSRFWAIAAGAFSANGQQPLQLQAPNIKVPIPVYCTSTLVGGTAVTQCQ